jgi:hypothetical protein
MVACYLAYETIEDTLSVKSKCYRRKISFYGKYFLSFIYLQQSATIGQLTNG